jgi:hypothetical protein
MKTVFRIFFPRMLAKLRPLQRFLTSLPLGAQTRLTSHASSGLALSGCWRRTGPKRLCWLASCSPTSYSTASRSRMT